MPINGTMSLRYLINIRIALTSLLILALSATIVIWQARISVKNELTSSLNLAGQLIQLNFPNHYPPSGYINLDSWLAKFVSLEQTRHLTIELKQPDGSVLSFSATPKKKNDLNIPRVFVHLISAQSSKIEQQLVNTDGKPVTLVITADPSDEIAEAWQESYTFFLVLLTMSGITLLAVNLLFNKTFRTITTIVSHLKAIESGNYQEKLPTFKIQEYDQIANAINHMNEVMIDANKKNQALTRHSLKIQEDERQYLARELHDELGQSLTAIKVMATTSKNSHADSKHIADSIISVSDHLINVVRTMMRHLHPLVLNELGLKASLEDLLNHWSQRYPELLLTLNCSDGIDEQLSPEISIQIFRVCQEGLTNMVRHAEATQGTVRLLRQTQMELLLEIEDNGKGSDSPNTPSGFGLLSIRERIKSLGGNLIIETAPQQGLKIIAHIPFT